MDAAACTPLDDTLPDPVAYLAQGSAPYGALTRLAGAAPAGIDVLVDTVGGEQLAAALGAARQGARFALVGALSAQLAPGRAGGGAPVEPVEIDPFRLVVRGVSVRGYLGSEHPDVEEEWTGRLGAWLRSGAIRFPHVRVPGIDRAPRALRELTEGRHFGAVVVELPERSGRRVVDTGVARDADR